MNIIIPILDKNKEKFKALIGKLADEDDIKIFVGIEEKNQNIVEEFEESENIFPSYFANNTSAESMINFMQKFIRSGATVIVRKPISVEDLNKFFSCQEEVATCHKTRSKFKNFIFGIWQVLLRCFLGIKEYEGDTSVVYLNEEISAVVAQSGNLSFSSRANRWKGIDQTTIGVKCDSIKYEIDKKIVVKFSLIASLAILLAIITTLAICLTVNVSIIIGLLIICLDVICFAIAFLTMVILIFNLRVGQKNIAEAEVKDFVTEKELDE